MSSGSDVPFPLLWSAPICTCRSGERCICGAKSDPHTAVREEVTKQFLQFRDAVYRYLRASGCPRSDAEDATQDAFLRLFRARLDGHVVREPLAYVITLAKHRVVDRYRQRRVERVLFQELSRNLAETLPDEGQDLDADVLQRERRAAFTRALQELSSLQRECLHWRAEGLSLRDTSAIVGVSEKMVSQAVQRGMKRLRRVIDGLS